MRFRTKSGRLYNDINALAVLVMKHRPTLKILIKYLASENEGGFESHMPCPSSLYGYIRGNGSMSEARSCSGEWSVVSGSGGQSGQ